MNLYAVHNFRMGPVKIGCSNAATIDAYLSGGSVTKSMIVEITPMNLVVQQIRVVIQHQCLLLVLLHQEQFVMLISTNVLLAFAYFLHGCAMACTIVPEVKMKITAMPTPIVQTTNSSVKWTAIVFQ